MIVIVDVYPAYADPLRVVALLQLLKQSNITEENDYIATFIALPRIRNYGKPAAVALYDVLPVVLYCQILCPYSGQCEKILILDIAVQKNLFDIFVRGYYFFRIYSLCKIGRAHV